MMPQKLEGLIVSVEIYPIWNPQISPYSDL